MSNLIYRIQEIAQIISILEWNSINTLLEQKGPTSSEYCLAFPGSPVTPTISVTLSDGPSDPGKSSETQSEIDQDSCIGYMVKNWEKFDVKIKAMTDVFIELKYNQTKGNDILVKYIQGIVSLY